MAARVIVKVIVEGTAFFAKGFFTAYQQALQNAKTGGGAAGIAMKSKFKMQQDEAMKILNIEKGGLSRSLLNERYEKFFESNNPSKGGSFYLQSKIYRAKQALDAELAEADVPRENGEKKS